MDVEISSARFNWDDARFFLAAYRAGSYLGAAKALNVSHSTVKRRVELLEQAVGSRLFAATSEGLVPTDAANAAVEIAEQVEQAAHHLENRLTGESREVAGSLVVTTVDGISGLLAPVVRAYHARFPEVRVQLHSNDRALDLRRREADVAVRVTKNPDEDLFGRKIADIGFRPFASAALVDEQGAKLRELRWIGRDHSAGATDTEAWFQKTLPGTEPIIRVTHTTSMVDLTLAGVGAAILPTPIGQRAGLTPLDDEIDELRTQLWCLCHRDLRYSDRVRGFMDVAGHALRL